MLFKSTVKPVAQLFTRDFLPISQMPQLYRADWDFFTKKGRGLECGGGLIQQLQLVTADAAREFKYVSIDSRSHMLMKDMYPCIPGWHCDDFYRPGGPDDQPDLENVQQAAPQRHFLFVLGDNSRTEFVAEDLELYSPSQIRSLFGTDRPIYYHYDRILETKAPKTVFVEPNHLYEFSPLDFHRGSPATEPGWRYFMRLTFSNHRSPKNEIRYQTQVYTTGRVSW